jgi:hypothetical protein
MEVKLRPPTLEQTIVLLKPHKVLVMSLLLERNPLLITSRRLKPCSTYSLSAFNNKSIVLATCFTFQLATIVLQSESVDEF